MTVAIVLIILLLAFILLRVPIPFAIFGATVIGMIALGGWGAAVGVFQVIPLTSIGSVSLSAVPLFIMMANLIMESGALDKLFGSARVLVGRLRGGTGIAAVAAGAGFASVSGSSTAAAATLARTSSQAMIDEGYSRRLATGAVASAGTLAAVIPPSVLLIFYAITAGTHIGKTMMAGLVPGIVMAIALGLTVWIMGLRGHAPQGAASSFADKARALGGLVPVLLLFLVVVGALFFGITTATEAAAVGCLGGFVMMLAYRKVTVAALKRVVVGTVTSSAMILAIVVSAKVFGHVLTETRVTQNLMAAIAGMQVAPVVILLVIMFVFFVLGFFMDQMAIVALAVPVALPVVVSLGYDPIWFGVLVILLAEIGLITPPLGLNAFVTARESRVPLEDVFIGSVPFIIAMLVVVALAFSFPGMVTGILDVMLE